MSWPLPQDLDTLHDAIINYAVRIHAAVTLKYEKTSQGPLSHTALLNLHRIAIVNHRSIRSLCEEGWTPTSPTLIRTLLDVLASSYAVVSKNEDAEYMGFRYMCSYLVKAVKDPDTAEGLRTFDNEQLNKMCAQLRGRDIKRVDDLIKNYKRPAYWYRPEFWSPGEIIKKAMPQHLDMYQEFSGSTHGSFIGSLLLNDYPDLAHINPDEHPSGTRKAVLSSSRLLLDVSWIRGEFHGVADLAEYKYVLNTFILPQKDKVLTARSAL